MEPDNSIENNLANNTQTDIPQPELEQPNDASIDLPNLNIPEATEPNLELPNKKSKKPLIIALICFLVLAASGTVAAIIILNNKGGNPVADIADTPTNPEPQASDLRIVGNSLSDFDLAFLNLEKDEQNKIYSPLSIKYALSMLADGASGASKAQITNLLGDYKAKSYLNSTNRSLANVLFAKNDIKSRLIPDYITALKNGYGAEVIFDPFTSALNANNWIEKQTLGQIKNLLTDDLVTDDDTYFLLINALAIDMDWNYKLQTSYIEKDSEVPNMLYNIRYSHENYRDSVPYIDEEYDTMDFNGAQSTAAQIGGSFNRYDIIKELGEDYIRNTVKTEYENWYNSAEIQEMVAKNPSGYEPDTDKYVDGYLTELKSNYGRADISTDFYFNNTDEVKVFAKDLKEYDGSTLQYVAVMPKNEDLQKFISNTNAEKLSNIIASIKEPVVENMKDGVVTKITGKIPFFSFNYELDLKGDLQDLGITDVFKEEKADLSAMLTTAENEPKPFILDAIHKANIDFSNTGIKATAVTVIAGGNGAGGPDFDYFWDVPVEEIDITFDKPFIFLIRDKKTGEVWFAGETYEGKE